MGVVQEGSHWVGVAEYLQHNMSIYEADKILTSNLVLCTQGALHEGVKHLKWLSGTLTLGAMVRTLDNLTLP